MNIRALLLTSSCALVACGAGINTGDDEPNGGQAGKTSTSSAGQSAHAGTMNASGGANASGSANVAGSSASGAGGASAGGSRSSGGAGGSLGVSGGNAGGAAQGGKGGSGGAGGGAGATNQGGAASGFTIDYSIWQLQLPTGDFVQPNGLKAYSDQWFKKAADAGQLFTDPTQGASIGSDHPRSELREMKNGVGAAWSASGTNTMTVTGKAIKGTDVTIGQIFHGDISTLAELQYSSSGGGTMQLLYEEQKNQAEMPKDLGVKVPLGQTYTFVLSLSKNLLTVTVNGHVGYSRTPSPGVFTDADEFYFKAGNYDQTSTIGSVSNDVHSQIEIYSVAVQHQ